MKKLAIVGSQELTRDNAPWENKEFDIWTITHHAHAKWCKRFDAVIEIHEKNFYTKGIHDPQYFEWLKNIDQPVYLINAHADIKSAIEYPLDEIKKELLGNINVKGKPAQNFSSSIDYTLALAILKGYEQIDIYGVEMRHESEYGDQQFSFSFWVATAAAKGIKVNLHCTNGLFNKPLYGKQDVTTEKLKDFAKGLQGQKAQLETQAMNIDGALMLIQQVFEN